MGCTRKSSTARGGDEATFPRKLEWEAICLVGSLNSSTHFVVICSLPGLGSLLHLWCFMENGSIFPMSSFMNHAGACRLAQPSSLFNECHVDCRHFHQCFQLSILHSKISFWQDRQQTGFFPHRSEYRGADWLEIVQSNPWFSWHGRSSAGSSQWASLLAAAFRNEGTR